MQISGVTLVNLGTTNPNVLAGQYIEFVPRDGIVQFGFTTDCAAATADDMLVDVLSGTDIIARGLRPGFKATPIPPVFPDDFHLSDAVAAGDRLIIGVQNKGAANHNLFWSVIYDKR